MHVNYYGPFVLYASYVEVYSCDYFILRLSTKHILPTSYFNYNNPMPNYLDSKLWKCLIITLTHVVDFDTHNIALNTYFFNFY